MMKKIFKPKLSMAVYTASFLLIANTATAAVINVNVTRTGAQSTTSNPGYGLWGEGANSWNTSGTAGINLVDSAGTVTNVSYSTTIFSAGNANSGWGPDGLTDNGRYGTNNDTDTHSATITGLVANQVYEMLVYHAANNVVETQTANSISPENFTGSATTSGSTTYNDQFDGTGHFYYYSSVSANSSGAIEILSSGPGYETFTGFQIRPATESIPEPSSTFLFGLGAIASAFVRRRK